VVIFDLRAYYASQISDNMSKTPEGFLICHNVPVARTGKQIYLAGELGLTGVNERDKIPVYRDESEVFSAAAMASFEGKPVTDDHPPGAVTPDNAKKYLKGIATNIRRGQDADSDKLIADLIIYDAGLMAEINHGKRDISCGYDSKNVETTNGKIYQTRIEGNHVAVVDSGRAGHAVSIKDRQIIEAGAGDKPAKNKRSGKKVMKKKVSERGIVAAVANVFSLFPKDAAPEECTDAVEQLADVILEEAKKEETAPPTGQTAQIALPPADATPAAPPAPPKADETLQENEMLTLLKGIAEKVNALDGRIAQLEIAEDDDPLSQLEEELRSGANSVGETVVITPGTSGADASDESTADISGVVTSPKERPKNTLADSRQETIEALRLIKPLIAAEKDQAKRQRVSDSLVKLTRAAYGLNTAKPTEGNAYADIMSARENLMTRDNSFKQDEDPAELGRKIRNTRNPHYASKN
jgi:hypothetical protein